jgi:hypothetical protein
MSKEQKKKKSREDTLTPGAKNVGKAVGKAAKWLKKDMNWHPGKHIIRGKHAASEHIKKNLWKEKVAVDPKTGKKKTEPGYTERVSVYKKKSPSEMGKGKNPSSKYKRTEESKRKKKRGGGSVGHSIKTYSSGGYVEGK